MNILFLSHSSTQSGFIVGSHHYAHNLTKAGHKVVHLCSPVSFLHLFFSKRLDRLKVKIFNSKIKQTKWLFDEYIPFIPFPYGKNKILDKINDSIIKKIASKSFSEDIDVVIVDQPKFYRILEQYKQNIIVYRPTDIYSTMEKDDIREQELATLNYAKVIIATSNAVKKHINILGFEVDAVINNGVDFEAFNKHAANTSKNHNCVYVGAIDYRFDLDLVISLANKYTNIVFDIYGPLSLHLPPALPHNLNFKNSVAYEKLPLILSKYRMALMPFNNHAANISRSPMKLFEYLSIGLPVLTKQIPSLSEKHLPIGVKPYDNKGEALEWFNEVYCSSHSGLSASCIKAARDENWESKAENLLKVIIRKV
jgi:teichuronic acid biosynthesis glycosyltransferase TuaH